MSPPTSSTTPKPTFSAVEEFPAAAARLAALGFKVKEMIGGLEYWRQEGCPVEGALGAGAPLYWQHAG